jgi:hypothetical protein
VVAFAALLALAIFGQWAAIVNGPAGNRIMVLALLGGVAAYVGSRDRAALRRPELYLAVLAVVIGISLNYAFLPIRSAHFPPINEGEPTTWSALWDVLSREQYQKPPLLPRQAELSWQYINYGQYFVWQFARDAGPALRAAAAALFAAIGALGLARQWRLDRRASWAMLSLFATLTVLLVFYLNFKYGYSVRPGENLAREVRERDYFFLGSFQLWGVAVALGLGTIMAGLSGSLARWAGPRAALWAAPVALLGLVPVFGNRLTATRAGEWLPRDVAWDILQSVEPYGILVTAGDNDTFPLWYMQEVEGVRQDVLVANTSLMNTLWHGRQLKRREIFPFDSATPIPMYRDRAWPIPTESPIGLSYEALDAIPGITELQGRNVFRVGDLRAVIQAPYLERADVLTLQLIRDNLGKRPIYFSRTVGLYAEQLGLGPYLLGQGLVRKLMPQPLTASDSVVALRSLGWVDLDRTRALMADHYHVASAARQRPRGWIDPPSEGILTLYALLYATLGDHLILGTAGDSAAAALGGEWQTVARRIFEQTSLGRRQ